MASKIEKLAKIYLEANLRFLNKPAQSFEFIIEQFSASFGSSSLRL